MVMKKGKKDNNILFIDASEEYIKITNNNKLSEKNIEKIMSLYQDRKDVDYTSKLISNEEISNNNYNISVKTYVEKEDKTEKIDIVELNKEIDDLIDEQIKLRQEMKKIISEIEV